MSSILKIYTKENRPFLILLLSIIFILIIDLNGASVLNISTIFSMTQLFATLGLVCLALSLTLMINEFDLSLPASFTLAGAVAVLTGTESPLVGLILAMFTGAFFGGFQGILIIKLKIKAVGLTLGGFLTLIGMNYFLTKGSTIAYSNFNISNFLQLSVWGLISFRGIIVLFVFVAAATIMRYTRLGRDIIAIGSNRSAAHVAGVNVNAIIVGVFSCAGALCALGGGLLSYSLQAASATQLSDTLVSASSAAILGGASLSGGKGTPMGIMAGVLIICLIRACLTALGTQPQMLDICTGFLLLVVAITDAPLFNQSIKVFIKNTK